MTGIVSGYPSYSSFTISMGCGFYTTPGLCVRGVVFWFLPNFFVIHTSYAILYVLI